MKTAIIIFSTALLISLAGCSSTNDLIIPLTEKLNADDTYTIIWNGTSEAYRYVNGQWQRAENYDYQFSVLQKRYKNQWKSVKDMHRLHPAYDGKAGARNQTMYFELNYAAAENGNLNTTIASSLGQGTGTSDKEFREQVINIDLKDASSFMPYNKIRITQHYNYEQGLLTETVELIKLNDGKETPFMKNEEKAYFYLKGKLDKAPTAYQQ
jgi:hypothetical protein